MDSDRVTLRIRGGSVQVTSFIESSNVIQGTLIAVYLGSLRSDLNRAGQVLGSTVLSLSPASVAPSLQART